MAPVSQEPEVILAQRLASNDKSIRTHALKTLRKYINLRSQKLDGGFTIEDLLKIWKGLFYCLWMQDKPNLQAEISDRISGLTHSFHTSDTQLLYFATFLQTIKREWNGIDRLRMDKFFQLVRFMFRQSFEVLKRRQWEASLVNQFLQVFTEQVLHNTDSVPKGLMLHILDLYMTELAQVGSAQLTAEQNLTFIKPFCKSMAKNKDRVLLDSISRNIFRTILDQVPFAVEDLIRELQQGGGDDSDSGNEEEEIRARETLKSKSPQKAKVKKANGVSKKVKNGKKSEDDLDLDETDDVGPVLQFDYGAVADHLFELGSRVTTQNINRTKLYNLVKSFRSLCEGLLAQKEDDNGDASSPSDKTASKKKKKKRRNEKPTPGDESVAKKSKVCQVQVGSSNNMENEAVVLKAHSQPYESASLHNKPDSRSPLLVGITVKKKRKCKKLKTNSQEVGGNVACDVPVVSRKSVGDHQSDTCKVKRKLKKCNADSGIGDQASTDVKVLDQNCSAQTHKLASVVESPVEAGQAECGDSFVRKKNNKKSKKKVINEEEKKTDTEIGGPSVEKPPEQISLYNRLETGTEVTQAKSQDGGPNELGSCTPEMKKKKRRKSKKLCSSLHDVGKDAANQSLPKEGKMRTLDNATDATQSQLETSTTQKKSHDDVSTHPCPASEKDGVTQCRLKARTTKGKKGKNLKEQVDSKAQGGTAEALLVRAQKSKKKKKETASNYQANLAGKEPEVSSDSADFPAVKKKGHAAEVSPAIHNMSTQQADTPVRKKTIRKKQLTRPTEEATKELVPKKIGKEKQATDAPDPAASNIMCTPVMNSLTPTKKGKTKRKLQTDKADVSQNEELGGKKSRVSGIEVSTSVTPKKPKMKKASPKPDIVSFQGLIKPPTPLFCKTKPKSSSPLTRIKEKFQTPNSETKKVTFGLKNNKTAEFRKTDRSLLVSPAGSSRVAFDPEKMPASGVLKSPSLSPVVSVKKHAARRATAADFF